MKKIFLSVLCLFTLMASVFAADSGASIEANTSSAQQVMASSDYLVTAGDIYTLVIQGSSFSVTIDASYRLRIGNLGIINVKGMTFQELKNRVETIVNNNYPTGNVQFYITNPASFSVLLVGEVIKTGNVETWSLGHLSEILNGRITEYASRRNVKVISSEGEEKVYDLFRAERFGEMDQDPYMHPGDKVVVSKYERQVTINGAVRRPGTYYLLENEQLNDLINVYADGFTDEADKTQVSLRRFVGGKEVWSSRLLEEADVLGDMNLVSKDIIAVGAITNTRAVFYIEGAINAGTATSPTGMSRRFLEYESGQNYATVVRENKDWFTNNSADLENAYIRRAAKTEEGKAQDDIKVNLKNILYGTGFYEDLYVEPDDTLYIPFIQYYVLVNGAVNATGRYPYQADKDWRYYINLANGFNLDQNLFSAVTIKDKNGKRLSKKSKIPPEATITASRNSPAGGWLVPLLLAIMSFITTSLAFYSTMKGFRF